MLDHSMQPFRLTLRIKLSCIVIAVAALVAGCGDTCFVAFSDNGKGGLVVKAGTTVPTCSLKKANAAIQVVALKTPVCEGCTAAARVEHVVVAVRGIEIRSVEREATSSGEWVEIAPQLAKEPREFELMGSGTAEIVVENASVPAGSYDGVRLELSADSPVGTEAFGRDSGLGPMRTNSLVMGDGHIEPLLFSDNVPPVHITVQIDGDSFALLPDSKAELQLRLEPRQGFYRSDAGSWTAGHELNGRVTLVRE